MPRALPLKTALMLGLAVLAWCAPIYAQQQEQVQPGEEANEQATEQPQPPAAEKGLIVRDLLVLQTSRFGANANDPMHVPYTLFSPIEHKGRGIHKNKAGHLEHVPMPLGLVTFQGVASEPMRMRVDLAQGRGSMHAHWPNDAQRGSMLIDWFEVQEAVDSQQAVPLPGDGYWLGPLRASEDRLWMRSRDELRKERFFLYDASIVFTPELELEQAEDAYRIKLRDSEKPAPPLTLLIKQTEGGWLSDTAASPWPEKQTTMRPIEPAGQAAQTLDSALAPLAEDLAARGYNTAEVDAAIGMVRHAGLDKSTMSLVYVMPQGQIDERLRLRFKPEPTELIRTTIVVLNNVDPDLNSRLNRLITDLGSDDWATRHKAQRELEDLGQVAISKVQENKNHQDPEVAFRVRQILDAYDMKVRGSK